MERITTSNLRAVMARMADAMNAPDGPIWERDASGQNRARVGALILNPGSAINGISWGISQICNESGGERTLLRGSTARELWYVAQAWLDGYREATRGRDY